MGFFRKLLERLKSIFTSKPAEPVAPPVITQPAKPVTPQVPTPSKPPTLSTNYDDLPWVKVASKEIGQREISGAKHNPRVLEYHATTTLKSKTDEVPWCASFINWVLKQCGYKRTGTAWARDFTKWGIPLAAFVPGCIVVFSRGTGGHVFIGESINTVKGTVRGLGGNQGQAVNYSNYLISNVLGFYWPTEYPMPPGAKKKAK